MSSSSCALLGHPSRACMEPAVAVMSLFFTSVILSMCAMHPVLGDWHCESEAFHAQLMCMHSVESIRTVNPECLAAATLAMSAGSMSSAHLPGAPQWKSQKKSRGVVGAVKTIAKLCNIWHLCMCLRYTCVRETEKSYGCERERGRYLWGCLSHCKRMRKKISVYLEKTANVAICMKEKKEIIHRWEVVKKETKAAVFKQRRGLHGVKEMCKHSFFVKMLYFKLLAATASGTGT